MVDHTKVDRAIMAGNLPELDRLLPPGAEHSEERHLAYTAMAAWCGQLEVLKYLHRRGFSWDAYATEWAYAKRHDHVLIYLMRNDCPAWSRAQGRYEKLVASEQPRVKRAGPRTVHC